VLASPMLGRARITTRLLWGAAIAAVIPDLDAVGRPFHRGDVAWLGGHRADTHSIFFALLVGAAVWIFGRWSPQRERRIIASYVTVVILSHGILDALATYGEGVAFFAPISMTRWKAGWQPFNGIVVEVLVLWLPALLLYQFWIKRTARE